MHDLGFFVGALLSAFIVSRAALWVFRSWQADWLKLVTAHSVTLLIAAFVGGIGLADGGPFAGVLALQAFLLPVGVWLLIDFVRAWRRGELSATAKTVVKFGSLATALAIVMFAARDLWLLFGPQPMDELTRELHRLSDERN